MHHLFAIDHNRIIQITAVITIQVQPAGLLAQVGNRFLVGILDPQIYIIRLILGPAYGNYVFRFEIDITEFGDRIHEDDGNEKQQRETEQCIEQQIRERIRQLMVMAGLSHCTRYS
jgi:hypothetical protein